MPLVSLQLRSEGKGDKQVIGVSSRVYNPRFCKAKKKKKAAVTNRDVREIVTLRKGERKRTTQSHTYCTERRHFLRTI